MKGLDLTSGSVIFSKEAVRVYRKHRKYLPNGYNFIIYEIDIESTIFKNKSINTPFHPFSFATRELLMESFIYFVTSQTCSKWYFLIFFFIYEKQYNVCEPDSTINMSNNNENTNIHMYDKKIYICFIVFFLQAPFFILCVLCFHYFIFCHFTIYIFSFFPFSWKIIVILSI